jgi:adenylate kinase
MNPIVFVGGIHGVGKTTLSRLVAERLSASHVTAGGLIRETASASHIVTVGIGNKAVPDVDANQELLLRGLERYRSRVAGPILLDGHFSLLDQSGKVVEIPMTVYEAIAPVAVLLVEADDHVVRERLIERDGAAPPMTAISLLAERERACAEAVGSGLRIPILSSRGDTHRHLAADSAALELRPLLVGTA